MVTPEIEQAITDQLLSALTPKDKEIARLIVDNPLADESELLYWAVRENIGQITEKQLVLEKYPDIQVIITIIPPSFFSDIFDVEVDVPFWQIANSKRVLTSCRVIYDPDSFLSYFIKKAENLTWDKQSILLKEKVTQELLKKTQKFVSEDMLADAYIWGIKAVEEAICVQLMKTNHFNITTPSFLLDSLNQDPYLKKFYLDLIGNDSLTPDLAFIALNELSKLADYLYHNTKNPKRKTWILYAFVSINEAERKLNRALAEAGSKNIDTLQLQSFLEDALAELWQAFFLAAQTPWNHSVPLDPWVVGLFWRWFVGDHPKYNIQQIIDRCELILTEGTPYFDWERT